VIISRTPLRVSFVGGGSDMPSYYGREPGTVVTTTIDKYVYIAVNPKFDRRIRASYSRTELVDTVDELGHELIREALKLTGIEGGVEITSISDIPSEGTGLGSSSAYAVGLLNAFHAHEGRFAGAERLASEAWLLERERCRKDLGKQDQYIAAYGGMKCFTFNPDDTVTIDPILCAATTRCELERRLLLLYTGITRRAEDILAAQALAMERDGTIRAMLREMTTAARQLRDALNRSDLDGFGDVLDMAWRHKRLLTNGITTSTIDSWYETARRHGAIGGKILGAGGGGFLLLYAPPERHEEIVRSLPELRRTPFRFEAQGSRLIYVEDRQPVA
jgi:D-glycero-alpha-D-manno-heptose-7-phosphate kinase